MEKELVSGGIGAQAKYKVEFKDGKLSAEIVYDGSVADASVRVEIPAAAVIEALKKAIPGQVDDAILELVKSALIK